MHLEQGGEVQRWLKLWLRREHLAVLPPRLWDEVPVNLLKDLLGNYIDHIMSLYLYAQVITIKIVISDM